MLMKHKLLPHLCTLCVWVCFVFGATASTPSAPDFAFPKKAAADARAQLQRAQKSADSQAAMRALLNLAVADELSDPAATPALLSEIGRVGRDAEPSLRAMTLLLRARILDEAYEAERYIYDSRSLPPSPLPADMKAWSGEQYRRRITALLDSALSLRADLLRVPLREYEGVVTQNGATRTLCPTLYDFVALRAADMMRGWRAVPHTFPTAAVRAVSNGSSLGFMAPNDAVAERIISIYSSIIAAHGRDSAPGVKAALARAEFVWDNSVEVWLNGGNEGREQMLMSLYNSYLQANGVPATEYASSILLAVGTPSTANLRTELYEALGRCLSAFPHYARRDELAALRDALAAPRIRVSVATVVPPAVDVPVKLQVENAKGVKVEAYDISKLVPAYKSYFNVKSFTQLPAPTVTEVAVGQDVAVPFSKELTAELTFPHEGNYIVVPVADGRRREGSYEVIHATRTALAATLFGSSRVWAVNPLDGSPLSGVALSAVKDPYSVKPTMKSLGTTGRDGWIDVSGQNGTIVAQNKADRFAAPVYVYANSMLKSDKWTRALSGTTSLSVYHPGDSVVWGVVCYEFRGDRRRSASSEKIVVKLFDAQGNAVDSLRATTDRFGRVAGAFKLPAALPSGRYSLSVDGAVGNVSFEVADYSLPTYAIEVQGVEQDYPTAGAVTLRGRCLTYAGQPLAGMSVKMKLEVEQRHRPYFWRGSRRFNVWQTEVHTDSLGAFAVTVPTEILAASPLPNGVYRAEFHAVSLTGESAEGVAAFTRAERFAVKALVPTAADLGRGVLTVDATVRDWRDSVMPYRVAYQLLRADSVCRAGQLSSADSNVNISSLRPGVYSLRMYAPDVQCDTLSHEVTLYSLRKGAPSPMTDLLWTPEKSLEARSGREARIWAALAAPAHVLVSVWGVDSLYSQSFVKCQAGMNQIPVKMPSEFTTVNVTLTAFGDYRQQSVDVEVKNSGENQALSIFLESFRDNLAPGAHETWLFRLKHADGSPASGAVVANMYNAALEGVAQYNFPESFTVGYTPRLSVAGSSLGSVSEMYADYQLPTKASGSKYEYVAPEFDTYGYPLFGAAPGRRNILIRGRAMVSNKNLAKDEAIAAEGVTADAGSAESALPTDRPQFAYRSGTALSAFFRPMLTTDSVGAFEIDFDVPQESASWVFDCLAYDSSMTSAHISNRVKAVRTLSVKPQLPKFLSVGDSTALSAMLINSSDEEVVVDVDIQVFEPTTDSIIASELLSVWLMPRQARDVTVSLRVPAGIPALGWRVMAMGTGGVDGEQNLIPVIPAVQPLVRTQPFYISPDSQRYSLSLDGAPTGSQATLLYCGNPLWKAVTQLPVLTGIDCATSVEAARSLFALAVARSILADNPTVAEAFADWRKSDRSQSALTSALERNPQLKQVVLTSTPWSGVAADQTARMDALAQLFDLKEIDNKIDTQIAKLSSWFVDSRGWRWTDGSPDLSDWATRQILELMGTLDMLNSLPESRDLREMCRNALSADTKRVLREFSKYPKRDFTDYLYLHSLFSPALGAPDRRVASATVQSVLKGWRKADLPAKAVAAYLLDRNGYKRVAREVLATIAEFAHTSPALGMSFPSLSATRSGAWGEIGSQARMLMFIHAVEPSGSMIQPMRQWLVLQMSAMMSAPDAASAVAALFATSRQWVSPAGEVAVRVGDKAVDTSASDRWTGEFTASLPVPIPAGEQLVIHRTAATPAWGAFVVAETVGIDSLAASGSDDLRIEKRILAPADSALHQGDKVGTLLTLTVGRDLDYVVVSDRRAACLAPVEQLASTQFIDGIRVYRENRAAETIFYIEHLPKGTYQLTYAQWATLTGRFASGAARVQSQSAPQYSANSSGQTIDVFKL